MDLDLDIAVLTSPGRAPAAPLSVTLVRELRPADFILLAENRETAPIELKRVSERHHSAARLVASGMRNGEIAAVLGMTEARLSTLKRSPAFAELVTIYTDTKDAEFAEVMGRMAGVSKDALLLIQERLEERPDEFTNKELREVATAFTDRTGFGPTQKSIQVNISAEMGDRLELARARAKASALGDVVEGTVVQPPEPRQLEATPTESRE